MKIAWLDDDINSAVWEVYAKRLKEVNIEIVKFSDVDKFFDYLEIEKPILNGFIIDIMMGEGKKLKILKKKEENITGIYVIRELLKWQEYKDKFIIIFTILKKEKPKEFENNENIYYKIKQNITAISLKEFIKEKCI